ncbi:MAG: ABC transporter substrate-binding protein [Turicibacter sp.]|nr:ABC transporter substrate-binding protein [Turicibacter sp.]
MKKLMTSLSILAGVTTLTACSGDKSDEVSNSTEIVTKIENPVKIEFWHAMSGANQEAVDKLVEQFNSTIGAEKGITVEALYQGSYTDLKTKTTAALKSGTVPALAQAYPDYVAEYLESGAVVELDPYIFNEEVGISDFEDIIKSYRDENSQYSGGKFYSLPFNKSTEVLYYNKKFFEENNLAVPTTWEEVEEVSAKIYELTGKPAFGFDSAPNYFITMVQQFGGQYTNSQGELLFAEDGAKAAIAALELLQRNTDAGYWRLPGEDIYLSGPFLAENLFMYIGSSAGYSNIASAEFEIGVAPIPQISEETGAVIQQGTNVVVFNKNKSSEEIYAAYEFAKYLSSAEANLEFTKMTSYLPVRESVLNSEAYQTYAAELEDQTKVVAPQQASKYFYDAAFYTDTYSSYNVRSAISQAVESVVYAGVSPEAAIEEALNSLK